MWVWRDEGNSEMWVWIVKRIVMKRIRVIKAIMRGNREIMEEGGILMVV